MLAKTGRSILHFVNELKNITPCCQPFGSAVKHGMTDAMDRYSESKVARMFYLVFIY